MRASLVLWVTPDASLPAHVHGLLPAGVTSHLVGTLEEGRVVAAFEQPRLAVIDLRNVADGGHNADRLLDELVLRMPHLKLIALLGHDAPETIERRCACSGMTPVRGVPDPAQIAGLIRPVFPESQVTPTIVVQHEKPNEVFGRAVLEGATHKFETNSPVLKRMLDDLAIAAAHDVTILLIGETGAGKTFLSKLIHETSPRRNEPFLHVACGALPRELIESELFGHTKGSFTSAHADKDGKFVAAGRGTVLLDEIDVLGLEQQVKLLKVIETGEFEPVGSNKTLTSQARLVVASNLDLEPLVEAGRFRPDVYYRLNMLKFEIPPLRKRKVDIIPLAKKFIAKFAAKHLMTIHRIEDAVLDSLLEYPWPGNVRELEHVIQRAVIYCRNGVLTTDQLPGHVMSGKAGPTNDPSVFLGTPRVSVVEARLSNQVAVNEREIIEQSLFKNNFSRTRTAQELGISRVTLYNKMKKYNMLK
jgi:DNA-binding NtrC family response regulator